MYRNCHFCNSYVSLKLFENERFIKKEGAGREGENAEGLGAGGSAVSAQVQGLLRLSSLEIKCPTAGSSGTRRVGPICSHAHQQKANPPASCPVVW